MNRITQSNKAQVCKIINMVPELGAGYLGFIITYPDGRIENKVLDYQPDNYELVYNQVLKMRNGTLHPSGDKR